MRELYKAIEIRELYKTIASNLITQILLCRLDDG